MLIAPIAAPTVAPSPPARALLPLAPQIRASRASRPRDGLSDAPRPDRGPSFSCQRLRTHSGLAPAEPAPAATRPTPPSHHSIFLELTTYLHRETRGNRVISSKSWVLLTSSPPKASRPYVPQEGPVVRRTSAKCCKNIRASVIHTALCADPPSSPLPRATLPSPRPAPLCTTVAAHLRPRPWSREATRGHGRADRVGRDGRAAL